MIINLININSKNQGENQKKSPYPANTLLEVIRCHIPTLNQYLSLLIKFSVGLSVCSFLETSFHKLFPKFLFDLIEQALRIVLVKTDLKYLWYFFRKSKITAKKKCKNAV